MKRAITFLVVLSMLFLTGCDFWTKNERLHVAPHREDIKNKTGEIVDVDTYVQMRETLVEKIESGATDLVVSVSSFDKETADFYVKTAMDHAMNNTPIGAYALSSITYEVGTNRGKSVIAFHMEYRHGIGEIMRIKTAEDMDEARNHIETALTECEAALVFLVTNYTPVDIPQLVEDYVGEHSDLVMEQPQVRVAVYPDNGERRVVELSFTYQNSRTDLRKMQALVEKVFTSADLYVQQSNAKNKYSRLYSFLMERNQYTVQTSITPSYSLLNYGVGDSRAFANVYGAMCRRAGLSCKTVYGTKKGEPYCWNAVNYNGKYYHVDLLECYENGGFRMRTDKEMSGYVWDYSDF